MIGGRTFAERRPEELGETAVETPLELAEADALPPELEPLHLSSSFDSAEETEAIGRIRPAILPWIAALVVLAWVGVAIWFARPDLVGAPPLRLVEFTAALCVPPALIGVVWLLALRNGRAEARRFAHTAQMMRNEAAALERTLAVLSREIDTNRRQLAEQTNALMAMGDGAAERLAAISNGMAHEMGAVDASARRLTEAAAGAQTNLGVLLTSLPRAHGEIAEMGRTLDSIALTAGERTAGLDVQLVALGERGREADAIAGGAAQRLAAHLQRMEATSETAGQRLEAVTATMSDAVDALLDRTASAVDEARKGITAQGDAILAMLSANQAALDQTIRSTVEALAERITTVESMVDRLGARLHEQGAATDALIGRVHGGFGTIEHRFDSLHATGMERTQSLAAAISALGGSADAMTEALRTGEAQAHATIQTTETLLTALDAAAREIDETLPEALARLDARIAESRGVVAAAKPELLALVTAAESTHDAIEAIAGVIQQQRATLDHMTETLRDALEQGRGQAETVGAQMEAAIGRTEDFAQAAAPRLIEALMRVRDTAATAAERARETLSSVIPDAARELEAATSAAMERALGTGTERQLRAIADAAELAVEAAQRASDRLNRQLLSIGEASAAVERRIEEAETERQAAEEENFARRAALLIEAMNSAAIDITKSTSAEVADTAWSAYLKGDRGVFTRRAVRLLEPSEAREIARLYDNDAGFRDSVNRYIHDFEAMLRGVLAQRDGSPMSVTLLSSDMGKLYVTLAQAIERLRA